MSSGTTQAAAPTVLRDPGRTAYNWLFRILSDRRRAKNLLHQIEEEPFDDSPTELLGSIRQVLEANLSGDEFERTVLGNPNSILSDLPTLDPGYPTVDSMGDETIKELLSEAQLGLVELAFVDRIPVPIIADHLGASSDLVYGFLIHVVDSLAGSYTDEFPDADPHPLRVIQDQIDGFIGGGEVAGGESVSHTPLSSGSRDPVDQLTDRCRVILSILSRDSRILSFSSRGFVSKVLRGPKVEIASREGWTETAFKGLSRSEGRAPVSSGESDRRTGTLWRGTTVAFVIGVMILAAWAFTLREPEMAGSGGEGGMSSYASGLIVGTYADPTTPSRPLLLDKTLLTGPSQSYAASLFVGLSLFVEPESGIVVTREGLTILKGRVEIVTDWPVNPEYSVRIGASVILITDGILKTQIQGGAVNVLVERGRAILAQPEASTRDLGVGEGYSLSNSGALTWTP